MLKAIDYSNGRLKLLDQRLLPLKTEWLDIPGPQEGWTAIRDMVVRGAPAIAIAAALSLAAKLVTDGNGSQFATVDETVSFITDQLAYLVTSRPTAVNLEDAATRLTLLAREAASQPGATPTSVTAAVVTVAEAMFDEDVAANQTMGKHGAAAMLEAAKERGRASTGKLQVLTHCNTGSLATAAFGTALGVVRSLHGQGILEHAYCTETRPYNQGSRLTAYELVHDGLPATLVCDSAVAALMSKGRVDAVVVGADRIAANGDTANKIGTFSVAVAAAYHGIPFFIAAPISTIDPNLPEGGLIPIEERDQREITHFKGERVAAEINAWNPGFDVTPAKLIKGVISEHGVVYKEEGSSVFDLKGWLGKIGQAKAVHGSAPAAKEGYQQLSVEGVRDYVAGKGNLASMVGPEGSKDTWNIREVGDGNLNFVYIIEGPSGALCIKQAPPYVRVVGESWPLGQARLNIEVAALRQEAAYCPEHVPAVIEFDEHNHIMVMQYIAPPHIILRHGMNQGRIYPHVGSHIATFMAKTLFNTSLLAMTSEAFRAQIEKYSNTEMCRLTEEVIFSDPFFPCHHDKHTSPQLDADVEALHRDVEAKAAISMLKQKFIEHAQALLHGDLHTGSLMVTEESTYAIDPEFAFVGPMSFDVGKIIGNFLLAYFAVDGHATDAEPRTEQRQWMLTTIITIWTEFVDKFIALWDDSECKGIVCPADLFGKNAPEGQAALKSLQKRFMEEMWQDSLRFCGACMIRRLVGIAHVADMESIADPDLRASCERRALRFGRDLLVNGGKSFATVQDVVAAAEVARQ